MFAWGENNREYPLIRPKPSAALLCASPCLREPGLPAVSRVLPVLIKEYIMYTRNPNKIIKHSPYSSIKVFGISRIFSHVEDPSRIDTTP